jgi:hypothetical protein
MEEFCKVLLIPIEYKVEMRVAGKLAGIESIVAMKDLDLSKLKLKVFHENRVIAVVVEEKDVILMLKAVCFIADVLVELHRILFGLVIFLYTNSGR